MYNCIQHGELESEWCEKCNAILPCDHSKAETFRQDLLIDCTDGERTPTIIIRYCSTCGKILDVYKPECQAR